MSVESYMQSMLELMNQTRGKKPDWKYRSYEELVLAEGQVWGPGRIENNGPIRECYANSLLLAQKKGYKYVEGFADSGMIPVMHAWCVDDDEVVETTWFDIGVEYYGVVLETQWALETCAKQGYWGVLPNDYLNDARLLMEGVPGVES